jgi:hypothetical protein
VSWKFTPPVFGIQRRCSGLALELEVIPNLNYKVDTNHDIVYMEFSDSSPSVATLESLFAKIGLRALFVGQLPPEATAGKKTQRIH